MIDRIARQLSGHVVRRRTVRIAGRNARLYQLAYGKGKAQEIAFVLEGRSEFELLCRRRATAPRAACVQLFSTSPAAAGFCWCLVQRRLAAAFTRQIHGGGAEQVRHDQPSSAERSEEAPLVDEVTEQLLCLWISRSSSAASSRAPSGVVWVMEWLPIQWPSTTARSANSRAPLRCSMVPTAKNVADHPRYRSVEHPVRRAGCGSLNVRVTGVHGPPDYCRPGFTAAQRPGPERR